MYSLNNLDFTFFFFKLAKFTNIIMKGIGGAITNNKVKTVAIVAAGVLASAAIVTKIVKIVRTHKKEKEAK